MGNDHRYVIAVDLDGTLAEYHGWKGVEHIGDPITPMVQKVEIALKEGKEIVIFTARVSGDKTEAAHAASFISAWLRKHGFPPFDITAEKRKEFREFWDDRAISIVPNEGVDLLTWLKLNEV